MSLVFLFQCEISWPTTIKQRIYDQNVNELTSKRPEQRKTTMADAKLMYPQTSVMM